MLQKHVTSMRIKDLCCDEQPREKMLLKGAEALSNAELLAILMSTGDGKRNAVEVCRDLLKQAGEDLGTLSDWSVDRLQKINGIGPAKALAITASFELARRWFAGRSAGHGPVLQTSREVYRIMGPKLRSLGHEEAWALYVNRSFAMTGMERVSSGSLTQTSFDVRQIVQSALEKKATAVIIVHNHPSGNPRPGSADIKSTEALKNALEAFDISLLDHIVICDHCWYSFADEQLYTAGNTLPGR